jgi:serine/threonine-protein phosphatase 2B regulatory subunit
VQRIIKVFDRNCDGNISFYEFVCGLSNLISSGKIINLTFQEILDDKHRMAFAIYDMDNDDYLSNGDLFKCLKMLVRDNLSDIQVQKLVDRTIIQADNDLNGKISYD